MNSLWPAVIAVLGTLSGTGLTLFLASRDKERSFKRDWLRQEFENRAQVYNDILAKMQAVIFTIRETKHAVEGGGKKPNWEPEMALHMKALRDSMSARTLYCSQEFRDIFNAGIADSVGIMKKDHGTEPSYIGAIEKALQLTVNRMEQQATKEVSLDEFRKRLAG